MLAFEASGGLAEIMFQKAAQAFPAGDSACGWPEKFFHHDATKQFFFDGDLSNLKLYSTIDTFRVEKSQADFLTFRQQAKFPASPTFWSLIQGFFRGEIPFEFCRFPSTIFFCPSKKKCHAVARPSERRRAFPLPNSALAPHSKKHSLPPVLAAFSCQGG